jgi:hypothetical protein
MRNNMHKWRYIFSGLLILGIGWLFVYSNARADEPLVPLDYSRIVKGGELIFVMLAPNPPIYDMPWPMYDAKLRTQYPQSGLYKNDGSLEMIWGIDWYAYDVFIVSDGDYLIRWADPRIFGSYHYDELALAFYYQNKEIKTYTVQDLVTRPHKLPHTVSHYTWLKTRALTNSQTLFVETLHTEKYTFDIATGTILEVDKPPRVIVLLSDFISDYGWLIVCNGLGIFILMFLRDLRINR